MQNEEQSPVSATEALISARSAEDAMRRSARSIRPSFAIIASAWLFQRPGPRRLIAQPGQHFAGRLGLVGVTVLIPIAGIILGTYTENSLMVVGLAIVLPLVMVTVPWWWERNLHHTVAGS
jgi:hypothetical protein